MKITALLVLKSSSTAGGEQQAVMLASACDLSQFGFFQRHYAGEFIFFVARTVALRAPAGIRHSVQHEGNLIRFPFSQYKAHCYKKQNGLCAIAFTDDHYPVRSAFSILNMDPAEADKLLRIQRDLDETKIILHKTIESVLARGERLDRLVEKSSDLSASAQVIVIDYIKEFLDHANSCC
uniref:Uncharacterized protein n=1 Tax=Leersia perrieri TaxID=77586 RepID=A0A0D9VAN6_9ORYZ